MFYYGVEGFFFGFFVYHFGTFYFDGYFGGGIYFCTFIDVHFMLLTGVLFDYAYRLRMRL